MQVPSFLPTHPRGLGPDRQWHLPHLSYPAYGDLCFGQCTASAYATPPVHHRVQCISLIPQPWKPYLTNHNSISEFRLQTSSSSRKFSHLHLKVGCHRALAHQHLCMCSKAHQKRSFHQVAPSGTFSKTLGKS